MEVADKSISDFFAQSIVTSSARSKTNCVGDVGSGACEVKETVSSRWEDMQLAMFLLGNAFRLDSGKPPEKVKQIKEAKVFFKEVEKVQKASITGDKKALAIHYELAREA